MKDNLNGENSGPLRQPQPEDTSSGFINQTYGAAPGPQPRRAPNGHAPPSHFSVWAAFDLIAQRWHWLVLGLFIGAAVFYLLGWQFIKPKFTATAQLLRQDTMGKSEFLKTTPMSPETLAGVLRAPQILDKVGSQLSPPVPAATLNKWIKIDPEPDTDLIKIMAAARTPQYAVNLVNLYASNCVEFIRDQEAEQVAILAQQYLNKEAERMDQDIHAIENQFRGLPAGFDTNGLARVGNKFSAISTNIAAGQKPSFASMARQSQQLQEAMKELDQLLVKYKPAHPAVQEKEEYIDELKRRMEARQMEAGATNQSSIDLPLPAPTMAGDDLKEQDIFHIRVRALEDARIELGKRLHEAQLYAENKPASVKLFAAADVPTLKTNMRRIKIGVVSVLGSMLGLCASIILILLVEFVDSRLKTIDDVARVTKLPVLTTLGNLHEMAPDDRAQWAFRTWTLLQGRLSPSANHGLICGITSAVSGEGRSTWISLLAEAASLTGYRVLTVATRPSPTHVEPLDEGPAEQQPPNNPQSPYSNGQGNGNHSNVLSSPAKITEALTRPNSQPVVHIPLPGWVWNLERRKQWREALQEWNQTENLVILVELPPATVPEAVLLGSNLPNMVWLADSGTADAGQTRAHLETLRNARCNLVGAVLNRDPGPSIRKRFPRWLGCLVTVGLLSLGSAHAQDNAAPAPAVPPQAPEGQAPQGQAPLASGASAEQAAPVTSEPQAAAPAVAAAPEDAPLQTNRNFSIVSPSQRAPWQQHLTLGPGDVLNLSLYGQPDLNRTEIAIGPDGRLSYLEAQDVMAAGLSIDELRDKLDQELAKFRRAPHTMLTPVAFRSKRYYMLGKVTTKGVFVLDRPLTVLEALARAHGLESALVDRNVLDLTDFQRSFIARGGRRISLNFEKLFQQGDLSQNIAVEPDDYIYFAPGDVKEVYVVGEIRLPGPVAWTPDLTVIGAITARGGYTQRAYKAHVLVVRGSLNHPEPFVVNTHAILDAKDYNFKLQPKDIVYVNSRPFIRVEEAADLAATAFIQAVITSWVGVHVVKPVQ